LFTTSESLIDAVQTEVAVQLETLPKRDIAEASLRDFGALCWCESLDQAAKMSDALAPEHLQLSVQSPEALLPKLQHAGAIFMGYSTAEVAGDYTAGPSHTLPTCGAARFTSGINVFTFLKSSSLLHYSSSAMEEDLHALTTMAREENLEGHARSAESRFKTTT
jgi:histidinol dehydrogenase